MCKTGFSIREDDVRCKICDADGTVTPLVERRDNDGDLAYAICEICVETDLEIYLKDKDHDRPVLTHLVMAAHVNRTTNAAVEQITARMIEYLDSMGEPRG